MEESKLKTLINTHRVGHNVEDKVLIETARVA